jgi:hypothetical protein
VALLEKRRYLNNRSGDFPQVILIVPSHVPNRLDKVISEILNPLKMVLCSAHEIVSLINSVLDK